MEEEREIKCFEDIGLHILSMSEDEPRYNIKALCEYAQSKGVAVVNLTDEEREQFRTN